jgi:hypothetical protein
LSARTGPPDDEGRARDPANVETVVTQTTSTPALTRTGSRTHSNGTGRQFGRRAAVSRGGGVRRGADLWREGYCRGYLAALVDVARAADDPEVWCLVDRVGENFTAPTADGYGLAGGDD